MTPKFYILCYDGNLSTIDDFRLRNKVYPTYQIPILYKIKLGDWFVLYEIRSRKIVGHGYFISGFIRGDISDPELFCRAWVSEKRNYPLTFKDINFLQIPKSSRLLNWRKHGVSKLTQNEFDRIFKVWWGLDSFSAELPLIDSFT
jgi:hypothetical protein